ncbi:MAG: cytochrome [Bdellovibrionaceae bacterium]|nr:cytochrome [Pseudobdellovibrionaceae bacterium]
MDFFYPIVEESLESINTPWFVADRAIKTGILSLQEIGATMFIQGDLQKVFDALFTMGVIDPVLEEDWTEAIDELQYYYPEVQEAIQVVNAFQGNLDQLMHELEQFDVKILGFLAMEVAKEFADFHSREELH